jgi:hypothetical protein
MAITCLGQVHFFIYIYFIRLNFVKNRPSSEKFNHKIGIPSLDFSIIALYLDVFNIFSDPALSAPSVIFNYGSTGP